MVFFGHALGGLAAGQPFQLGGFDQETQGIAGLQFLRPELAQAFDSLGLQHEGFARVPVGHFLEGGDLLGSLGAFELLVPGDGACAPVPALRPAADGAGRPGPMSGWGPGRSTLWRVMIVAAGRIEGTAWPQVPVQAEGRVGFGRFSRQTVPRR